MRQILLIHTKKIHSIVSCKCCHAGKYTISANGVILRKNSQTIEGAFKEISEIPMLEYF